jgi:hypothetical protein
LQWLVEAVTAPGWKHRDGRVSPAGLLGTRTGRGAATDRLALLLLMLEARETGRVRQCGGAVDTKRGRAAATVARLLGCTAAGERVLERLEETGSWCCGRYSSPRERGNDTEGPPAGVHTQAWASAGCRRAPRDQWARRPRRARSSTVARGTFMQAIRPGHHAGRSWRTAAEAEEAAAGGASSRCRIEASTRTRARQGSFSNTSARASPAVTVRRAAQLPSHALSSEAQVLVVPGGSCGCRCRRPAGFCAARGGQSHTPR